MSRNVAHQPVEAIQPGLLGDAVLAEGLVRPSDLNGEGVASAEAQPAAMEPAPCRRVILLSGEARVRRSVYLLEGTLFAPVCGPLEGEILWTVGKSPWPATGLSGVELVRGSADSSVLQFSGYSIEKPFVKERYRLVLYGADQAGVFHGASEAYGVWDAELSGRYQIVNLSAPSA